MTELQELILSYVPTGISLITYIVVGFAYLMKLKNYVSKNKIEDYTEKNQELIDTLAEQNQKLQEQNQELRQMNSKLMESVTRVKSNE